MNFSERASKTVLEAVLPGAKLTYRNQQSNGEYDFDLQYSDGRLAAVEVTTSVDQRQMQTSAAIHSKKKLPVIAASQCRKTWMVTPMPNANVNVLRENVDKYLAALEGAGIDEFSVFEVNESRQLKEAGLHGIFADKIVPECVESICDHLMLQGGGIISSDGPPKIILGYPIYGGAVGAACAINAGKREAWKEDNRRKLNAATNERYLVVFIDATNGLAWTALTDCDPPDALPELPPEIDQIWLLGDLGEEAAKNFVVWRADKTTHWQKLEIGIPAAAAPVLGQ